MPTFTLTYARMLVTQDLRTTHLIRTTTRNATAPRHGREKEVKTAQIARTVITKATVMLILTLVRTLPFPLLLPPRPLPPLRRLNPSLMQTQLTGARARGT